MTISRTPRDMALAAIKNLEWSRSGHESKLQDYANAMSKALRGSADEKAHARLVDRAMGAIEATVQAIGLLRSEFASLLEGQP